VNNVKGMKNKEKSQKKKTIVAVSGGFDPIHIGHVRLIQEASRLGDEVVVILNNDNWLMKKKKFVFMPEKERKEVIEGLRSVSKVIISSHKKNPSDMSVAKELEKLKPDVFAQGGDRKDSKSIPSAETLVCEKIGARIVYNVGWGGKVQSSSLMAARMIENAINNVCPCKSGKSYTECGLKNTPEHKKLLKNLLNG